jgi:hypothetical protein
MPRARWKQNVRGPFAVGDLLSGSVKRVAGSVGEGIVAAPHVHFAEQDRLLMDMTSAASV